VAVVQLDEPVLSEVVFTGTKNTRSFMCGALSEKGEAATELAFAQSLLGRVVAGLPRARLALHVCRGNWTRDERAALAGDYRPLLPLLAEVPVGTLFLELATPRACGMDIWPGCRPTFDRRQRRRPEAERVGPRRSWPGPSRVGLFGAERVLLTPDCAATRRHARSPGRGRRGKLRAGRSRHFVRRG
jgi:5-methyltetrahydropteroyltriglutamate--homocysteine methyltransferase